MTYNTNVILKNVKPLSYTREFTDVVAEKRAKVYDAHFKHKFTGAEQRILTRCEKEWRENFNPFCPEEFDRVQKDMLTFLAGDVCKQFTDQKDRIRKIYFIGDKILRNILSAAEVLKDIELHNVRETSEKIVEAMFNRIDCAEKSKAFEEKIQSGMKLTPKENVKKSKCDKLVEFYEEQRANYVRERLRQLEENDNIVSANGPEARKAYEYLFNRNPITHEFVG